MLIALVVTVGLQLAVIYLPFFNKVFKTHPLSIEELGITVAVASIVFWAVEIEKVIKNKFRREN
jgi:Ca2+-transporting ATPase